MFYRRADRGIRKVRAPRNSEGSQLNKREHMRRTTIVLACAMIAPLAFAQTRTTKTRQTTTTQPAITPATTQMATGAVAVGTVTAFTPGQTTVTPPSPIVVQSSPDAKPISYVLGRKVRYVDKDGRAIDPHLIRAGTRRSEERRVGKESRARRAASN